jgi:hypothetical protein
MLFEQHRSALGTLAEIERRGWRLKSWTRQTGDFRQGGPFDKNSLRRLLTNVLHRLDPAQGANLSGRTRRHCRAWLLGASAGDDDATGHVCARESTQQTPRFAERTASL